MALQLGVQSKSLFSQNGSDTSFKLFKDASPAPQVNQPAVPRFLEPLQDSDEKVNPDQIQKSLQALQEMLGQSDAAENDLQTSFEALSADPAAQKKLKFIEEGLKRGFPRLLKETMG